jgi:uncharacterized protein YajQ (UPF0234 family)
MPSLDIVCRVNMQEVDNAVNNTRKAIAQRFDFRNVKAELTFDQKEKKLHVLTEDNTKMEAIRDMFQSAALKRGLNLKTFKFEDHQPTTGAMLKREVLIREGLEMEVAKDIVKRIKATGLKVQAAIQGDEIRLSGKKIDDLRSVMALLEGAGLELPLQYVNMKS